jgi:hypothetical protein
MAAYRFYDWENWNNAMTGVLKAKLPHEAIKNLTEDHNAIEG